MRFHDCLSVRPIGRDPARRSASLGGSHRASASRRAVSARWLAVGLASVVGSAAMLPSPASAAEDAEEPTAATIDRLVDRGIDFLRSRGQADDGSFSSQSGVAVTALCVRAILENRPQATADPMVRKALAFIESHVQSDGGIYTPGSRHQNYETAISVLALVAANRDNRYDSELSRADAFLKGIQWDEGEGVGPDDVRYGGAGYGSSGSRPDLSNTSFLIEALRELGNDADDEAIQKALRFVTRTQNLKGHGNDTEFAEKVGDGGFYYTPAGGGESQAGKTADGGLRSYASMTYAGLKSMIYAGLTPDDPRVQAAIEFIRNHYSVEDNPGMGQQGLFYYYQTFAKALEVAEIDTIDDAEGQARLWRRDLVRRLAATQQDDGSWVNLGSERWMEGDRQLVTAYALLALARARQ